MAFYVKQYVSYDFIKRLSERNIQGMLCNYITQCATIRSQIILRKKTSVINGLSVSRKIKLRRD